MAFELLDFKRETEEVEKDYTTICLYQLLLTVRTQYTAMDLVQSVNVCVRLCACARMLI